MLGPRIVPEGQRQSFGLGEIVPSVDATMESSECQGSIRQYIDSGVQVNIARLFYVMVRCVEFGQYVGLH